MKKTLILSALILIVGLTSSSVIAQVNSTNNPANNNPLPSYTLLEPLPCIPSPAAKDINGKEISGSKVECSKPGAIETTVNFKFYVQYMFNLFIAVAAGAAVFMIVYGGLKYMSTDSWNGKADGIEKMKNALLGLLLVLTSYIILRTIDPRLVAIPTTLVPPLNIKYEKTTNMLLDKLRAESERLKVSSEEARQKIIQSENKLLALQDGLLEASKELEELRKLGFTSEDPEIIALEANLDAYANGIKRENANARLVEAKFAIDTVVHVSGPSLGSQTPAFWTELNQKIDTEYDQKIKDLQTAGAEADQIKELERYRDYSKIIVELNRKAANVVQAKIDAENDWTVTTSNENARIESARRVAQDAFSAIAQQKILTMTDPVLKSAALNEIKKLQVFLGSLKAK